MGQSAREQKSFKQKSLLVLKRDVFTSFVIFGTYYTLDINKLSFFGSSNTIAHRDAVVDPPLVAISARETRKPLGSSAPARTAATAIRAISPKYCKARMQYFRVADILLQPCLIDAHNVRGLAVHLVLEAMEVTHGLAAGPGLGLISPDIKRRKVASEFLK